ncbi:MAG: asparagine synthetase B [Phycisphaerales bacterium]
MNAELAKTPRRPSRIAPIRPPPSRATSLHPSMCGIAGILRVTPPDAPAIDHANAIPETWLDALDARIRHRGPDGHGRFRDRAIHTDGSTIDVALVHRRLSILDHALGAQPMLAGHGPFAPGTGVTHATPPMYAPPNRDDAGEIAAIAFNGCIYNHRALRAELESRGERFASAHSDTEAILRGFRVWREDVAARLDGMFAALLWDRRSATLTAMRDVAGEKPLYRLDVPDKGITAFASTVPALVALARQIEGCFTWNIDAAMAWRWLTHGFGCVSMSLGCARVGEVESGTLECCARESVVRRFWRRPVRGSVSRVSVGELGEMVDASVRARLDADVDVGIFLSGGIDSGLVAASVARAGVRATAYTVSMGTADLDERALAARTARRCGLEHRVLECSIAMDSAAEDVRALVKQLGLPLGDSSVLPTTWISRAVREECRVVLTGDGGDELFFGYDRYRGCAWLQEFGAVLRRVPRGVAARLPGRLGERGVRLVDAARWGGYDDLLAVFPRGELRRLGGRDGGSERDADGDVRDPAGVDFGSYLPGDLMRKVDTATMSVALESRSPMLAGAIREAGLGMSLEDLGGGGVWGGTKRLLRELAMERLDPGVARGRKRGFGVAIDGWYRRGGRMRGLFDEAVMGDRERLDGLIGEVLPWSGVERLVAEHDSGAGRHGQRLFVLTSLALWLDWLRGG